MVRSDTGPTIPWMKLGFIVPLAGIAEGEAPPPWSTLEGLARHAETAGADGLWVFDHLLFRGTPPDTSEEGIHEALVTLTAVAAVTTRVDLGCLVFATPFRPPAVFAKMLATLDAVAGGRLIAGLGCGWHQPEFDAFGLPFDHRVGRFEEALAIILPLLRGERVTFAGRWHGVSDSVLLPPPVRTPPTLIAAKGDRMLDLTATHADAWNTAWFGLPDERWRSRRADLEAAIARVGRTRPLAQTVGVSVDLTGKPPEEGAAPALRGDVAELADGIAAWRAEGVDTIQVNVEPATERTWDLVLEANAR